jgi:hypothetical protein
MNFPSNLDVSPFGGVFLNKTRIAPVNVLRFKDLID